MADPDAYVALISSLPSSERLFIAKQPPLSRIRLENRLSALSAEDSAALAKIEQLMSWGNYDMADSAEVGLARAKAALDEMESETLRSIIMERMDLRTVVAALRMRRDKQDPPSGKWALSRLVPHIRANWADPHFQLDNRLPWLREAVTLMDKKDPLGLERHILEVTFQQLNRHAARHHFDFEAVVIYVLKWNIFDRWSRSDATAAASRFETLAQDALGDFTDISLQEPA